MTKYLVIILLAGHLFSCTPDVQVENDDTNETNTSISKQDTSSYNPDPNYTRTGEYPPYALEDIKIGKRLLLGKTSLDEIIGNQIKSIQEEGYYIEKFNEKGLKIYEKYANRTVDTKYKYELDKDNKPLTIHIIDNNDNILGSAKYKYDTDGKLLQAGGYILKYHHNGQLKSVEDAQEIERYEYDEDGNLSHINFDIQPDVLGCGNRTSEWKGEYNDNKQLIRDQTFGFPDGVTRYFEYANNGQISKTKNISSMTNDTTSTEFIYSKGLLTQTKTFNQKGILKFTKKYKYEKY